MGIQRSSTNKPKMQPGNDRSTSIRASNVISHLIEGGPISIDDASYDTWVVEHPSALGSFDQMMRAAKGKKIAVFLDYDGTLAPIVDNPDLAFMSDEMRAAVREVAKYFPTAIISGRSRDKVKEFVQLSNVFYAGSHGMDILAPPRPVKSCDGKHHTVALDKKGNEVLFQPAKKFLPAIQKMRTALKEKVMKIQGARVEDNRFCISVHFRQVREEDYEILEKKVKSVLEHYPEFHLSWGKKVMLRRGQGYPIIVTSSPKDTKASFSLRDPSEVLTFLLRLARWRKSSSSSRLLAQIWGVSD
ncbi:probable trehalose-phosphate phosphatase 2 isoform X3 [Hevea brasiliensis]|uniref:probable trehalose-phosphate phosphatase 2 isoform X3 n=1 Tax=Hevea brasiliensis TaxID=3981 RepID=UPI0025E5DBFA|nr:probable trehalose-phosphate phosphatase 2 isoform X3 [Hevea brasiliensis]